MSRPSYADMISDLTEKSYSDGYTPSKICDECGTYILEEEYWEIGGQTLCNDCATAMYKRREIFFFE